MIKLNESGADRIIRVVLGAAMLALGWGGVFTGTIGWIFKILGFLPLITGLIGWCPAYALLKVRTNK